MKIDLTELLIAIKTGRSSKKGISDVVSALSQHRMNSKILESIHVGLSKLPNKEIKKFVDSL